MKQWVNSYCFHITVKDSNPPVTEFDLFADKSYTVTVTGNYNQGTLKAEIDLNTAQDITFDFYTFN